MIRYFLAKGDRGGSATITDGLEHVTCSNPPPRVHIATLYMTTCCTACKRVGYIAPKGPRWPGTAPNGKRWALSGDINICGCNPPPVFYAERSMKMTFTWQEVATLEGSHANLYGPTSEERLGFDRHFRFVDECGNAVEGIRVHVTGVNGETNPVTTDRCGCTPRMKGSADQRIGVSRSREKAR